jgi:diacylglycerol kinase family enzyme
LKQDDDCCKSHQPGNKNMKLKAILNRESGAFRTTDMEAYSKHAIEVMTSHGHLLDVAVVSGSDVEDVLEQTVRSGNIDAMLVGGGDGTISAAAALAWKHGMPLGVIPAGTMNLFARSLGMPLDPWDAIETLARGEIQDNDIATCNGQPFIHQFSAGLHARMVRLRNKIEYASRVGKLAANVRASVAALLDPPAFKVTVSVDGKTLTRVVSAVSVSANPFGPSPLLVAQNMSSGELGLYLADPLKSTMAAGLAFDIIRGRLRESPLVLDMYATSLELTFPDHRKTARCVIDGELVPLSRELAFRIHKGELKVIAPAGVEEPIIFPA